MPRKTIGARTRTNHKLDPYRMPGPGTKARLQLQEVNTIITIRCQSRLTCSQHSQITDSRIDTTKGMQDEEGGKGMGGDQVLIQSLDNFLVLFCKCYCLHFHLI